MISEFQFLPEAAVGDTFEEGPFGHRDEKGRWRLNVLVLYDADEAAAHALHSVSLLGSKHTNDVLCVPTFWHCGLLSSDLIWEASMNAAQNAELILLAARDGDSLPQQMEAWVQDYYAHRAGEEPALVYTLPKVLT